MERGVVGRLPFLAMGSGAPMLFVGGLAAGTGVDAAGTERLNASLLEPFATRRRVMFVNRRSGLPRGMSMADLAAEHAEAIGSLGVGPVDVAGISTGGSIAQQLAADHPDVVGRLVLLCTACRLGPEGRALQRRVAARIRRGARRPALAVMIAGLVPPGRGQVGAERSRGSAVRACSPAATTWPTWRRRSRRRTPSIWRPAAARSGHRR
jgi:pimeloyl-ACP methyl ester carboxylesterase